MFGWLPFNEFKFLSRYNALCIVYICFGACFYGYDSGITSSVLAYESFLGYFDLNNVTIGAFNSAYYAACAVGTALNWWLPNKFGRLRCIQGACCISIVGIILQTASVNFAMFIVGRVVGGIACGIIFALCPVYASEISPPFIRGRVAALYSLNISFSYMVTEWFGLAFYFIKGNASWRLLFGLQFVPATIVFIGSFWMPFSPRWLALKGRYDECLEVLRKIHDNQEDHAFYEKEFHQIRAQIEQEKAEKLGLIDIFRKNPTLVGLD
jgi:MFS family permease